MKTRCVKGVCDESLINTYGERQSCFDRGEGAYLYDESGRRYLDMVGGIAVCSLGHCHPVIVDAICSQSRKLIHVSNLYYVKPQADLAELLVRNSFADRVFFANSGAEANECAIKMARKYGSEEGKTEIITMDGSFHGRTIATLTATGQEKVKTGFAPYLPGFKTVEFNSLKAVERAATAKTVAVMIEPVQGERGNRISSPEFIKGVRKLCDSRGILLIFDEIQCGLGRTGRLFAYEHYGVRPDIMTLAKPLGGGLPLGAVLAGARAADVLTPGSHGSTFGGNPVACAAGTAALKFILSEGLVDRAARMGDELAAGFGKLAEKHRFITDVRCVGLMAGFELSFPGKKIVDEAFKRGLLVNCTSDNFIRFLPPLTVSSGQLEDALDILEEVFKGVKSK